MGKTIINLFSGLLVSKKVSGSCQKNVRVNSVTVVQGPFSIGFAEV